jgi:alkylation response protein AidB-like acyl-CoA dehydrogenase
MSFELSAEQEQFRASLRRFLAERAPTAYVRSMYEDARGTTDEMWRCLVDLGITAMLIPESQGGLGLGMVDAVIAAEELGKALHPGPYLASAVAATLTLVGLTEHDSLLPDLASGQRIATLALLEPGHRYAWHEPDTRAHAVGKRWELNGTKVHVPDATAANTMLVVAAAPDGLGVFAVDSGHVSVTPEPALDGSRKHARIDLRQAPARRIGEGDCVGLLAGVIDRLLVALVADGLGTAEAALGLAVAHARSRQQFGTTIGSFQAVQRLCVDMYCRVEVLRSLTLQAATVADEAGGAELHRAAAMAKAFAGDAVREVGELAIQVHGGVGVTWEHDVGLFYKRCLSAASELGDALEHYEHLAASLLPAGQEDGR